MRFAYQIEASGTAAYEVLPQRRLSPLTALALQVVLDCVATTRPAREEDPLEKLMDFRPEQWETLEYIRRSGPTRKVWRLTEVLTTTFIRQIIQIHPTTFGPMIRYHPNEEDRLLQAFFAPSVTVCKSIFTFDYYTSYRYSPTRSAWELCRDADDLHLFPEIPNGPSSDPVAKLLRLHQLKKAQWHGDEQAFYTAVALTRLPELTLQETVYDSDSDEGDGFVLLI